MLQICNMISVEAFLRHSMLLHQLVEEYHLDFMGGKTTSP